MWLAVTPYVVVAITPHVLAVTPYVVGNDSSCSWRCHSERTGPRTCQGPRRAIALWGGFGGGERRICFSASSFLLTFLTAIDTSHRYSTSANPRRAQQIGS